ncbi:MAG: hypothetical protein SF029_02800 [bacterium]|nr:hypothetical protein [bacterium]
MRPFIVGSSIGIFLISTLAWFWSGLPGREFSILVRAVFEISVRNSIQMWQTNFIPLVLFIFCSGLFLGVLKVRRDFPQEANDFLGYIWSLLDVLMSSFALLFPYILSSVVGALIGFGVGNLIPSKNNMAISLIGIFWGLNLAYLIQHVGINIGKSLMPVRRWHEDVPDERVEVKIKNWRIVTKVVPTTRRVYFNNSPVALRCAFIALIAVALFGSVWVVAEQIYLDTHTLTKPPIPSPNPSNDSSPGQSSFPNQAIQSSNSVFAILSAYIIGFLASPIWNGFVGTLGFILNILTLIEDGRRQKQ